MDSEEGNKVFARGRSQCTPPPPPWFLGHNFISLSVQEGGVENVQYTTTIKEREEEAHMQSAVQGLPQ